jgi:hypothetical protein
MPSEWNFAMPDGFNSVLITVICFAFVLLFGMFYCIWRFSARYRRRRLRVEFRFKSRNNWCNDYSQDNLDLHIRAAKMLGIIKKTVFDWDHIGEAMGMRRNSMNMVTVQCELGRRISKSLGVSVSSYEPNWQAMAEKFGINGFAGKKPLPIPFIIYAFCELFHSVRRQ